MKQYNTREECIARICECLLLEKDSPLFIGASDKLLYEMANKK